MNVPSNIRYRNRKRWDTPIRDASQWNLSHALYVLHPLFVHIGFAKRTGDKTVFGIRNGRSLSSFIALRRRCTSRYELHNILPIGKLL